MGKVIIKKDTTKFPISMIGCCAGVCWGANIEDKNKNYVRGLDCLNSGHGRTFEFPDVYMILDGYSARVIREFYTHIGGAPTRLQESTRYINYGSLEMIEPHSISKKEDADNAYKDFVNLVKGTYSYLLNDCGIPNEDVSNILPLGMATKVMVKINLRTLIDMSRQRMCTRAYWEFRQLFKDICEALCEHSEEWKKVVNENFMAKCDYCGYCVEKKCCGRKPKKEEFFSLVEEGKKFKEMKEEIDKIDPEIATYEDYFNIMRKYNIV